MSAMQISARAALVALMVAAAADGAVRPELAYTKMIGGSATDSGRAVATDSAGNVYIAGTTTSPDFPLLNAYQKRIGGTPLRSTTDGGKTWTLPGISEPVYAVAGTGKQPATIYAGTTSAIYKSVDSGKTWLPLPGTGAVQVNALWVDPATPAIVHAGTDRGMLRSTDGGGSWQSSTTARSLVLSMAAHPAQPARLFVAANISGASIYRTIDSGATWAQLRSSPVGAFSLAADNDNPDVVYAATAQNGFSGGGVTAIYRTKDGGDTWTQVSDAALTRSTFTLGTSAGAVFAGATDSVIRSADGGTTWTPVLKSPGDAIAADPTQPGVVYASTAAGVFASADNGLTWKSILPVRLFLQTLAVAPTTPSTLFVGAEFARNVFVTKLSPDGKTIYSTFLGGSYLDTATGIAVDRQGNAYISGYTYSNDFPVTAGAVQTKNASNTYTPFVAKLGPNGDTLAYSTYFGGSGEDVAFGIALDDAANIHIGGFATSGDFPTTAGAFATKLRSNDRCATIGRPIDGFAAKIDPTAGVLRYSTLLGGGCLDQVIGIAVDAAGSAYIAGLTNSPDFPITAGAAQTKAAEYYTGFVAKLSPQGNSLVYSTYSGGGFPTSPFGLTVDAKGSAYVTGTSLANSLSFSNAPPAITVPTVGLGVTVGGGAYVEKLNPAGSAKAYLQYLGNSSAGYSVAVVDEGKAWVAGAIRYNGPDGRFPTMHPFQAKGGLGFVAELGVDGATLFSSVTESLGRVAVDRAGNALVVSSVSQSAKGGLTSASLMRIDADASHAATVEEPTRIALSHWFYADAGVAAGEILTIRGSGLGPAQALTAQIGADGKLATSLGGTRITFDGVPAPLLSVQADQVVCIAPFALSKLSSTVMRAETAVGVSNAITMPTIYSNLEALTVVNADGTINSKEHPAAPDSVVTVYGAGFGLTTPASEDGRVNGFAAAQLQSTIGVSVGDQNATVLYSGPAPGQVAGVVQVNFRVPKLQAGSYETLIGWTPLKAYDYDSFTMWVGQ